jgi:nucleotide-binding universal stress UspA family protein
MDIAMSVIVSYDGTPNDDDALTLGRMLTGEGVSLSLAYVRHAREYDPGREEIAQHDAERRLEQGATLLGDPDLPRHVVFNPSTGEGLAELAAREGASMIVFGSDYRTPPGRVEPGTSAQRLLEGGTVAIAVAPAGLRTRAQAASIRTIAVSPAGADPAAHESAKALAEMLSAEILNGASAGADLIIVGSRESAPEGQIGLSGATRSELDSARSSVLVVPRGVPVDF